jgi:ABC-type sugar transport system permease subunit
LSVSEWNLIGPRTFVGLENYTRLLADERFWNSFGVTLGFVTASVAILMFVSFWLAVLLTSSYIRRGREQLQSMIFIPVILSMVAIAVAWRFMFQSTGILSIVTQQLFGATVPWLTSTTVAPWSVILTNVWKFSGYYMVMFIAGLVNVPPVYYEAARMDGAKFRHTLIHITIPSIRNTISLAVVSCLIFSFGSFALQYVMTEGGPSRSTEVLAVLIYKQAFQYTKIGYAAATSVVYFATLLTIALVVLRLLRSEDR